MPEYTVTSQFIPAHTDLAGIQLIRKSADLQKPISGHAEVQKRLLKNTIIVGMSLFNSYLLSNLFLSSIKIYYISAEQNDSHNSESIYNSKRDK